MKLRISIFLLFFKILTQQIFAQNTIIGTWKDFLPYLYVNSTTETPENIFCATENGGIFWLNKNDNSLHTLSKISGLSDIEMNVISYNIENQTLIVGYKNGNVDLIKNNDIINISDIKRKQLQGSKTINKILCYRNFAYLSCGFGIVVLNLTKNEIFDTYYIGKNGNSLAVLDLTTDGNSLFAATSEGIFSANLNAPNLADNAAWTQWTNIPNFDKTFNAILFANQNLYFNFFENNSQKDTVFVYNFASQKVSSLENFTEKVNSLILSKEKLIILSEKSVSIFDSQNRKIETITQYWNWMWVEAKSAFFDDKNSLWLGDKNWGLMKRISDSNFETFNPNSPHNSHVGTIKFIDNQLLVVGGGKNSGTWDNLFNFAEFYTFNGEKWTNIVENNYRDFISIAKNGNKTFVGSWGNGIFEYENGTLTAHYLPENSSLKNIENTNLCRIGGLIFDNEKNLWATNTNVTHPISVRKKDGTWKNFAYKKYLGSSDIGKILITQNGTKWVQIRDGGLLVFHSGNDIENESDDKVLKISVYDESRKETMGTVFCFAQDQDGAIWLGTGKGITVFYSPDIVFEEKNFYSSSIRIRSEINGLTLQWLLSNETVTAICVDAANRKWIGTENSGIFLLSADGTQEISHFNETNSPLPSNFITDIAINQANGEVFIGTNKGLVSYKSDAAQGEEFFNNVLVYPNPVKPDFEGKIVIKGLVSNVNVKITDITGNLVYETTSLGGQAIWNAKTFSGNRVKTGIYLIFCTDFEGTKTFVTKILIL